MKNSFKLLLVAIVWAGIPACIKCPNYWKVSGMKILFFEDSVGQFASGQVESDSVSIIMQVEAEEYACQWGFSSNSAYAWSCGHTRLEHGIAALEVFSNADFNGIPAGQPINSKLSYFGNPIDSLLQWHLQKDALHDYFLHLNIKEKPAVPKHKFTIKLTDDTGDTVTSTESGELEWL